FILRSIAVVCKAQRTGFKAVFIRLSTAGNHRSVQLRMVADVNIKAAVTCEDPGLLLHRVVITLHLIAADTQATATAARPPGVACASIHALLFAVIFIVVLKAAEGQVAPSISRDFVAIDLCP